MIEKNFGVGVKEDKSRGGLFIDEVNQGKRKGMLNNYKRRGEDKIIHNNKVKYKRNI